MPLSRPSSPMLATQTGPARPPKASALSWLVTTVLEGFAAYANAMHPVCYDLSEQLDRRGPQEDTPFHEGEDMHGHRRDKLLCRSECTYHIARHRTLVENAREKPTIRELDIIDERMLQDVGLHRRPIDTIQSNDDPCE